MLQHVCGQVLGTIMHAVLSFLPRQDVWRCTRFDLQQNTLSTSDGTGGPLVLPGNPERALRYEFSCKVGGKPEFRYCQGEWTKHVESVSFLQKYYVAARAVACGVG